MAIKGYGGKLPKASAAKVAKPPVRKMGSKPYIRMQKLKPVPGGAFPTAAAAFPPTAAPPMPDQAMAGGQPGAMPGAAGPGDMTG